MADMESPAGCNYASSKMDVETRDRMLRMVGGPSNNLGTQQKVFVELLARQYCRAAESTLLSLLRKVIKEKLSYARSTNVGSLSLSKLRRELLYGVNAAVTEQIEAVTFEDEEGKDTLQVTHYSDMKWIFYVYRMQKDTLIEDTIGEDIAATVERLLPSREYHRLWESLIYESAIKKDLLNYAMTTVCFSELDIDSNLVTWNKVILLHGPPGTGKTSMCKALAQKLAIRLSERYARLHLIEVNSHSLFSRWFSESGKLVMKMFERIEKVVRTKDAFVCLLIDEVESLARARQASVSGNEPSDALRAVNALLTQIDKIKQYPNVLILTTSNISESIDLAFVDRADVKKYIGNPTEQAIMHICVSFLEELMKKGLLNSDPALLSLENSKIETSLKRIARLCVGMSGRTLRKLPFLTYADFFSTKMGIDLDEFLEAMAATAKTYWQDAHCLSKPVSTTSTTNERMRPG